MIRVKEQGFTRTTKEVLQRKLLRGKAFEEVESIDEESLTEIHELLTNSITGVEYNPPNIDTRTEVNEKLFLEDRRRKLNNALNRLKALYLYEENTLPEKDFIIERKRILDDLKEVDEKLSKLNNASPDEQQITDEFLSKASYFIMVEKLLEKSYVDYEKYIRHIEPGIPRNFIKSIITDIVITDGKVMAITFKNGITHKFIYKDSSK